MLPMSNPFIPKLPAVCLLIHKMHLYWICKFIVMIGVSFWRSTLIQSRIKLHWLIVTKPHRTNLALRSFAARTQIESTNPQGYFAAISDGSVAA